MSVSNPIYNVNVHSKFAMFLDEEIAEADPDEILKKVQLEKKKKDIATKEAKRQKNQKQNKPEEPPKPEEKKPTEKAPRFQKNENRSVNKFNSMDKPPMNTNEEDADKNRKNKRIGTGPPRRFRGREYDRHSGSDKTGVKPVDKRDGSGAHNWGSIKDDVEAAQDQTPKEEVEKQSDNEVHQEVEKKEPEKVTMTISEWKALNKENSVVTSTRHRAANNGEDVFSGMNAYKKRNKTLSESDNEVIIPDDDVDSKGRREIKVNVEFTGRRRGGGRGGYANRFNREATKKVEKDVLINLDENEFPTLS